MQPPTESAVEGSQVAEPVAASPFDQLDLSGTLNEAVRRVTAEVERRKVGQALQDATGDKARAAEALQISYKALLQKQREHGIKG
jgi:DNA-binding NtrC family response regulator